MELKQILDKLKEPEKLVELNEMALMVQYLSQFVTDFELAFDNAKIAYSLEWERIKYFSEKPLSDKQTDIAMMRNVKYLTLNQIKRDLSELKRHRGDLMRRMDVIMNIKRR